MRVLLIEPDLGLGRTIKRGLEQAGFEVDWRRTAQGAISAADEARPDVVVLELQMATHNGIEFLYEFRSYVDWRDVPVVIHTLVPEENFVLQKLQLRKLGVSDYLYKPNTSLNKLVEILNKYAGVR